MGEETKQEPTTLRYVLTSNLSKNATKTNHEQQTELIESTSDSSSNHPIHDEEKKEVIDDEYNVLLAPNPKEDKLEIKGAVRFEQLNNAHHSLSNDSRESVARSKENDGPISMLGQLS